MATSAKPSTARKLAPVALDLDSLERPAEEIKPEFAVTLAGRRIVFTDANDIDWQILRNLDGPDELFEHALSDDDRDFLLAQSLPGWKFGALWEAYQAHFGLDRRKG